MEILLTLLDCFTEALHTIRVTHDRTPEGEAFSWLATQAEVFAALADRSVALTVAAHTHFPFVQTDGNATVANCGAASALILGVREEDGTITPMGGRSGYEPPAAIYSTYLSVTCEDGGLHATVERFDYDRAAAVRSVREASHPDLDRIRRWIETGVK